MNNVIEVAPKKPVQDVYIRPRADLLCLECLSQLVVVGDAVAIAKGKHKNVLLRHPDLNSCSRIGRIYKVRWLSLYKQIGLAIDYKEMEKEIVANFTDSSISDNSA
ncbi:MAG: hypothetical protein U1E51_05455 [Candidatus Binatia bacterium]|nr:hypothetical protein [Candidatus Binatia bacterium]